MPAQRSLSRAAGARQTAAEILLLDAGMLLADGWWRQTDPWAAH